MNDDSTTFDFTLSRNQRFRTMLSIWWKGIIILVLWLPLLFTKLSSELIPALLLLLVTLFFYRGLLFWLINLRSDGKTHIRIEENGIGFGRDKPDLWIACDGVREIRKNTWGTTSICHHNGTIIDIPSDYLTESAMDLLKGGMDKYFSHSNNAHRTERPNKAG